MKELLGILALACMVPPAFAAGAADKCRPLALAAAEDFYGSDPKKTQVEAVQLGVSYFVKVGIGNDEDGEHDYTVVFPAGCASQPSVAEVVPAAK